MELSEALLSGKVKFKIRVPDPNDPARKQYIDFQGCAREAFPDLTPETFPLAFCCPLFVEGANYRPKVVLDLIPADVKKYMAPISFVCQVIDCLAVAHGWDEKKVGEWLQVVERAMDEAGLDREGRERLRA
jgi:hypothetical protein